jgi:hypothetical protein
MIASSNIYFTNFMPCSACNSLHLPCSPQHAHSAVEVAYNEAPRAAVAAANTREYFLLAKLKKIGQMS